jgi:hypothetical protein
MTPRERHFTVADPRDFDANPFEVGDRAVAQIDGLLLIAEGLIPASELMARNAEMTRRVDLGQEPEGDRWVTEPQGRQWQAIKDELAALRKRLRVVRAATAFDPKNPPK